MSNQYLGALLSMMRAHRRHLREALVAVTWAITGTQMGDDIALAQLPDTIAGLKDLFIVRCAKSIRDSFGITNEAAIHEATFMAKDDGLIETELTRLDDRGHLLLDLTTTFPLGVQDKDTFRLWAPRLQQ
ncbi:hypothetical protein FS749_005069 [Ceratobasidium sp. UAMH 11750]|nr:hypothetical protein FS749_005069 [Ceratobasidium sp. UAMH 11750]